MIGLTGAAAWAWFAAAAAISGQAPGASPPAFAPATPPRQIAGEFSGDDYPAVAMRRSVHRPSQVRVAIGPDGRATGCSVVQSSGEAALDERACTILVHRFRWTAATDSAGRPVASSMPYTIEWRVRTTTVMRRPPKGWLRGARRAAEPASGPQPPSLLSGTISDSDYPIEAIRARAQGNVEIEIHVDTLGRPSACTIVASSGHTSLDEKSCDMVVTRFVWAPARDEAGQPVAATTRRTIRWQLPTRRGRRR